MDESVKNLCDELGKVYTMKIDKRLLVPHWLAWTVAGMVAALIGAAWWLSLAVHGGNCYKLGERMEQVRNPARQFVEDGTPFLWYKGTYYRVQYVRPKMFRVLE